MSVLSARRARGGEPGSNLHRQRIPSAGFPIALPLADQACQWLKERIFTGELGPGSRLSIEKLAAEIGVSRTPIRDAVNRLALEGLVVVTPRRATVVSSLDMVEVEEVFAARALLEPSVCAAVARTASDSFIADLGRIHQLWERLDPNTVYRDFAAHSRYAEADASFHLRIVAEMRNSRLDQIFARLNVQRRVAPLVFGTQYRGPARRMEEHRAIFDAISRRDPVATDNAVRRHVTSARAELIAFLAKPQATALKTE